MRRSQIQLLVAAASATLLVVTATTLTVRAAGPDDGLGPTALLPDLDQETPTRLGVREELVDGHRIHVLGFASAIRNIGVGPLDIAGRLLPAGDGTTMSVDQLVRTEDGATDRVHHVGELRFVTSPDHDHWHYAGFDRYELRAAGSTRTLVRDQKSGFCLGDRYQVTTRVITGAVARARYTDECGLGRPDLTSIEEGISVGFGDNYAAYLEYQDLPLDG